MAQKALDNSATSTAALMNALLADDSVETLEVVGTPEDFSSGIPPKPRLMRLDDIEDDCPACEANRARIESGDPPTILAWN